MATDALERLRQAQVIEPDKHSTTQFEPYVHISALDRDVIATYIESHEAALAAAIHDIENLQRDVERFREALDWIYTEPEEPMKVQLWAKAALER